MDPATDGRHLAPTDLADLWSTKTPILVPVLGNPPLQLLIDGGREEITLTAPLPGTIDPPVNELTNLRVAVTTDDGEYTLKVTTIGETLMLDGYSMLCSIADRIQLHGLPAMEALEETIARWRSMLAAKLRMSVDREIGLFGELLVLERVAAVRGESALQGWRGPDSEEHDFGYGDADVEVKTTAGEQRRHWIHGLGQLVESPRRSLWLVSVQITRGGADSGRTLGTLIDELKETMSPSAAATFAQKLVPLGWTSEQRTLLTDRWAPRSHLAVYHVSPVFPRLTTTLLANGGASMAHIHSVNYQLDLAGVEESPDLPDSLKCLRED